MKEDDNRLYAPQWTVQDSQAQGNVYYTDAKKGNSLTGYATAKERARTVGRHQEKAHPFKNAVYST